MQDITQNKLQLVFEGPGVAKGRLPARALGNCLRGQSVLAARVATLLYGEAFQLEVEIDDTFVRGSLGIPIYLSSDLAGQIVDGLPGTDATACASLLALLGFWEATSLYDIFRRFKGRPIRSVADGEATRAVTMAAGLNVTRTVTIYNDAEVQKQIREVLDPLRCAGVSSFHTRWAGVALSRVEKQDLLDADAAEVEELTGEEEKELDIEKAALRRTLAWHFRDGDSAFDANIDDDAFWLRVEAGEAFADGDQLRVRLQTTARRTANGRLEIKRRIPEVIQVEHGQRRLQRSFSFVSSAGNDPRI